MRERKNSCCSTSLPMADQPVHSRKVPPEVAGAVGGRHFLGIDHHWVALQGSTHLKLVRFREEEEDEQTLSSVCSHCR